MPGLNYWLSFIRYIIKRYREDDCNRSAAALTYTSLFAVVPLMTVMYATLSMVPAMQSISTTIESFVFENFVPTTGHEVQAYLQQFSQQARKLTGAGIALLAVTAILMLRNIENIFNQIWRTRENRKGLSSFLLYWAMLSLGPLCIGLAFGITTYLLSLQVFSEQVDKTHIGQYLLTFAPYLLTSAAFTLIFAAVPNCKVPIKHAAIGGLLTALCFEIAKFLFARLVANASFELIYGTFAAIPLFLMWIYVSWLIVLAGAELVQALSAFHPRSGHHLDDLTLSLAILERLATQHRQGEPIDDNELLQEPWLLGHYSVSADRWPGLRDKLLTAKLLGITQSGHYVLGKDLHHFTLLELLQLLDLTPQLCELKADSNTPWYHTVQKVLHETQDQQQAAYSMTLGELFGETS